MSTDWKYVARHLPALPFVLLMLAFFVLAAFSGLLVDAITGKAHSKELFKW